MRLLGPFTRLPALLAVFVVTLSACTSVHVHVLAHDDLGGRVPGTPGHTDAQGYITGYLAAHGAESRSGSSDPAAFLEPYNSGTNIVAQIPGTDLADEIVLVGAHYDHVASCGNQGGSSVCNGATDNAAGVAIALEIAAAVFDSSVAPRRTVMFALWDQEEAGLLGSGQWIVNNAATVGNIVAYVNYDIQGANLLPSVSDNTFAVGSETGGTALTDAVGAASSSSTLNVSPVSLIFGQGRSDHASFAAAGIPTVFFSDSTGGCYHTNGDSIEQALDPVKLQKQRDIGVNLVTDLASGSVTPTFVGDAPLAVYADAVAIHNLIETALPDFSLFTSAQQATMTGHEAALRTIVDDGEAAFDAADQSTLLSASLSLVSILSTGPCDSFTD